MLTREKKHVATLQQKLAQAQQAQQDQSKELAARKLGAQKGEATSAEDEKNIRNLQGELGDTSKLRVA